MQVQFYKDYIIKVKHILSLKQLVSRTQDNKAHPSNQMAIIYFYKEKAQQVISISEI
jgi:hypothetical protein